VGGSRCLSIAAAVAAAVTAVHAAAVAPAAPHNPRTYVYRENGDVVGYVERTSNARDWNASRHCDSSVWADKKGRYGITDGSSVVAYAFPRRASGGRIYYIPRSAVTLRWISPTRRDIFDGTRRIAHTRGPDGVAAGLSFYVWGDADCMLPR
jgi:hypothetical protein